MSILRKLAGIIFISIIPMVSFAGGNVSNDLQTYFNQLGFASNVTSPHAYHGQQAGYYTGGSVFVRNQVRDVTIAHMDAPTIRSGCGGIDIYTGGISIINADDFQNALKNIMNSGGSYAMTLALEEASPLIANVMKYWNQASQFINQSNLNSCETAEALVGGMWPQTRAAQQRVCEDVGTGTGYFNNWAQARQGCGFGNKANDAMASGKNDPRYKDLVLDHGNLAWQAIQKNDFLKNNNELSYLFMSLSGTVIIKNNGKSIETVPSNATDKRLMKALLYGGEAEVYYCADNNEPTGCLELGRKKITVSTHDAFQNRVKSMLDSMVAKIRGDIRLTDDEIGLLQSTQLPIYKMLNVQVAYNKLTSPVDVGGYADIIALDILFQYLEENLTIVKTSSMMLPYPPVQMDMFQRGMETALDAVRTARKSAYQEVTKTTMLIEQTQFIEKMLAGSLSAEMSGTVSWAKGMRGGR